MSPSSLPLSRARLTLVFVLGTSLTLSILLIAGRVLMTGRLLFLFLIWNLFLALIPYALSTMLGLARGRCGPGCWCRWARPGCCSSPTRPTCSPTFFTWSPAPARRSGTTWP
ncbi:hypothetical protein ACFQT0_14525 [Hymenobacter humi]|uniref:Uncharacterized protein n=1 Tax=Hymenobacter humi TaxID=1411620 RepID=A0ABW2U7K3_9BACT